MPISSRIPLELAAIPALTASIASMSNTPINDVDWGRMVGSFGGLFVSVIMLIVMMLFARSRIKKDDAREERRIAVEEDRRKDDR
jgi:Ca2+/Na+ antiporter